VSQEVKTIAEVPLYTWQRQEIPPFVSAIYYIEAFDAKLDLTAYVLVEQAAN